VLGSTIIIAIVLLYQFELMENIFDKIDVNSNSYTSYESRVDSIFNNFSIFMDNFLVGTGLTEFPNLFNVYSSSSYGVTSGSVAHSTNSFMSVFATYGIIFGALLICSFCSLSKIISKNIIQQIFIFISLLMMFSNEDMRYSLFFFILIFFGLKSKQNICRVQNQ